MPREDELREIQRVPSSQRTMRTQSIAECIWLEEKKFSFEQTLEARLLQERSLAEK
jgi:hypothetical protein